MRCCRWVTYSSQEYWKAMLKKMNFSKEKRARFLAKSWNSWSRYRSICSGNFLSD